MKICLTLYVQIISMHGRYVVIILFMQNMKCMAPFSENIGKKYVPWILCVYRME